MGRSFENFVFLEGFRLSGAAARTGKVKKNKNTRNYKIYKPCKS